MEHFSGMDLHGRNTMVGITDEKDNRLFKKRFPNYLPVILSALEPYKGTLKGIAVESTFNWYWLVDGLMDAGYPVFLAHPAGMVKYNGLKRSDDGDDAFWLAHLLRLGILPQGFIYPKEERQLRDLLRKRLILVNQCTSHILGFQSLTNRNIAESISSNEIKKLKVEDIGGMFENKHLILSGESNIYMIRSFQQRIALLEKAILKEAKLKPEFQRLLEIPGIGNILAMTIALETGDISRFEDDGNYASYCRCVDSEHTSNGKKKGEGNRKNGNKYLAWAYVEAANFARRYCPKALAYYNKKLARTNKNVATKSLAGKICKVCYYLMRDDVAYDPKRAFGQ